MSSRLFKHQMAAIKRYVTPPSEQLYVYSSSTNETINGVFSVEPRYDTITPSHSFTEPDEVFNATFSPDGKFLVLATKAAPWLRVYRREEGGAMVEVALAGMEANPISASLFTKQAVSFSQNSTVMLVGVSASRRVYRFVRSGDGKTYTLVSVFVTTGSSAAGACCISPDGDYFITQYGTNNVRVYKWDGVTYTAIATLTHPTTNITDIAMFRWAPDGKTIYALTNYDSYKFMWWTKTDDTISSPKWTSVLTGALGFDMAPDGKHFAFYASNVGIYAVVQKLNADGSFTAIGLPATIPGSATGIAYSKDGTYLAVTHYNNDRSTIFRRVGDAYMRTTLTIPKTTTVSIKFAFGAKVV